MNIALVVPGGVDRSGTHRVIPRLLWQIERMARQYSVHVFAMNQYPQPCEYPLHGAIIHNLGTAGLPRFTRHAIALRWLLTGLRTHGPFDVIHAFWAAPCGLLSALAGRRLGIPSVVSLCSGELVALPEITYGSQLTWHGRAQVSIALRLATSVTASSRYMVELARGHGSDAAEIPLGVPSEYFENPTNTQQGSPGRLLHVASLNRVKDQTTLLRAMKRVANDMPGAHLDIVGEDTLGGTLQRECANLGLSKWITFHGFKTAAETRAFYRSADVLVLASRHDAGPLVMMEAAAHGVPTVGTRVGHAADWHPDRAIAVSIGDHAALADGVLALLQNPRRRITMGQAAQAWARAHDADWTAMAFARLYGSCRDRFVLSDKS